MGATLSRFLRYPFHQESTQAIATAATKGQQSKCLNDCRHHRRRTLYTHFLHFLLQHRHHYYHFLRSFCSQAETRSWLSRHEKRCLHLHPCRHTRAMRLRHSCRYNFHCHLHRLQLHRGVPNGYYFLHRLLLHCRRTPRQSYFASHDSPSKAVATGSKLLLRLVRGKYPGQRTAREMPSPSQRPSCSNRSVLQPTVLCRSHKTTPTVQSHLSELILKRTKRKNYGATVAAAAAVSSSR